MNYGIKKHGTLEVLPNCIYQQAFGLVIKECLGTLPLRFNSRWEVHLWIPTKMVSLLRLKTRHHCFGEKCDILVLTKEFVFVVLIKKIL